MAVSQLLQGSRFTLIPSGVCISESSCGQRVCACKGPLVAEGLAECIIRGVRGTDSEAAKAGKVLVKLLPRISEVTIGQSDQEFTIFKQN